MMPRLREVEIAEIMEEEPRQCHTCNLLLEEHEEKFCPSCKSYWDDVSNGLFDDWNLPDDGRHASAS